MGREPILKANSVIVLLNAFMVMLVVLGVVDLSDEQQAAISAFAVALVNMVGPIVAWQWARRYTTPYSSPRTKDNEPAYLVPRS